jgi:hypothetical protein
MSVFLAQEFIWHQSSLNINRPILELNFSSHMWMKTKQLGALILDQQEPNIKIWHPRISVTTRTFLPRIA